MKRVLTLLFFIMINYSSSFSQGIFSMSTNKVNYSYGEIIEVKLSIFNNTDSTLIFHPECVYPMRVRVKVKGVYIYELASLADGCERWLKKGEKETWTFLINPEKLGFPLSSGEQTIYGSGYYHKDSLKISAPKYYGGIIEVPYDKFLEKEKRDKLFNDLNALLVKRDTSKSSSQVTELWTIKGRTIDSLANALNNSRYFQKSINTYRWYDTGTKTVTAISKQETVPDKYILEQNYPNPFNPSTTISYTIPVETGHAPSLQHVILKVYDLLGREVATLVDEYKQAGSYQIQFSVETLHGASLPSGMYFYVLRTTQGMITKKMVLMK